MLTRMLQRRGTAAEWFDVRNTAILQPGEIGLETDTGKFKVGDGTTVWISLPYYLPDTNPTSDPDRIGNNNADIYSKLRATQTFKGSQILTPEATDASQTPLTVSAGAATSQSAILQRWRTNADGTLATLNASGYFESKGAKFTEDVDMSGKAITGVKDIDSNSTDSYAVNKKYVDEAIAGLTWKAAVNLAATTNVTLTGATNTLVVDGHDPLIQSHGNGYRILLLNQTTVAENGIYDYFDDGTNYTLTRSEDADTLNELEGASVFVQEGSVYGTSSWVQTDHYLSTFADQQWVQFNGASQITAGDGMTKLGNVLDVGAGSGITVGDDTVSVSSLGIVTAMIANDAVTDEKIADNAVAQANMKDDSVGTAEIINSSITTDKINTAAVTHDKLATDAVDQSNMQNASVGTDELIDDSVTHAKVADDAIKNINVASDADIAISKIDGLQSALDAKVDDSHVYSLDDLGDVVISSPQPRQVIKYDQDSQKFINEVPSGGISVGIVPPEDAAEGDAWFDSTDGSLYVRYNDGTDGSETLSPYTINSNASASVRGYTTALQMIATYDSANSRYSVAYTYALSATSYSFSNATLAGSLVIGGQTVWSPSGQYAISQNSTVVLSSGTVLVSVTPGQNFNLTSTHSVETTNINPSFSLVPTGASSDTRLITVATGSSSQWVQVKANSALEASILTRISAVESRSTKIEAANAVRVANATERDSVYPAPVQGNTVFRADLGYEEKYYAAYNATTNPDGTTGTIGWYEYRGGAPLSKNYLLNSDFKIGQRIAPIETGAQVSSGSYGFDRWRTTFAGSNNWLQYTQNGAALWAYGSNTSIGLEQRFESKDVRHLSGKTLTLSFDTSVNATGVTLTVDFILPSSTDNWASSGSIKTVSIPAPTSITRTSVTINNISSNVERGLSVKVSFVNAAGNIDTARIKNIQLEEGPVATFFRTNTNNPQAELAACQRYYEILVTPNGVSGAGFNNNGTVVYVTQQFKVTKRATPDVSYVGNLSGITTLWSGSGIAATAFSAVSTTESSRMNISVAGGLTTGQAVALATSSAVSIVASAEL